MKNKTLLSILLAVVMVVTMLPMMAFAAPRTVTAASTASITVEQAVPNDELSAYKVIDITVFADEITQQSFVVAVVVMKLRYFENAGAAVF